MIFNKKPKKQTSPKLAKLRFNQLLHIHLRSKLAKEWAYNSENLPKTKNRGEYYCSDLEPMLRRGYMKTCRIVGEKPKTMKLHKTQF